VSRTHKYKKQGSRLVVHGKKSTARKGVKNVHFDDDNDLYRRIKKGETG